MKCKFEIARTQGAVLAVTLVFLVLGSGVSLLHAYSHIA